MSRPLRQSSLLLLILSPALLLTLASPAVAADAVTLDQALDKFSHSPRVERAQSAAEEASWRRVEANAGFLPTLTGQGQRLVNRKWALTDVSFGNGPVSVPQILPTTYYGLGLQWTVFDGFANFDRWRSAKAYEVAGRQDFDWARFQGERDVILLFYKALAAQTLRDVAEQNIKTLEDHLEDTRLFKRTGVTTKFDVLRVEVQTSEARSELMNANDAVAVSVLRLGEAIGDEAGVKGITGQLPVLPIEIAKDLNYDEGQRSDLRALESRVKGASEASDAAAKYWVPRISLLGNYQQYNNIDDSITSNFREAYSVGVGLTWNIFDGAASYAKHREAVESRTQAEKGLILARLKSKSDFEFWKRRYVYFASVYKARQGDIEKSAESVRLAREGRKVGTRTNTDLLDAELELFRARAGLVNAQIGSIEALINLEIATGRPLFRF